MLELILDWISGDLSPSGRVWSSLAPAILVVGYFVLGLLVFSIKSVLHGIPRDEETLHRGRTVLVGYFLRHYFFWAIRPLWRLVLGLGIPPKALTLLATLIGVSSGVAVAAGRFALGGWLFLFAGVLDTLDGRLARAKKLESPAGAALDSVLDRYVDSALLMGLAWYYRSTWVLAFVLLALLGSSLVPYVRARGEGLGVSLRDGVMQRLERVLFLGLGTALSPVFEALTFPEEAAPMHWICVAAIVFVAVLSNFTALSRLWSLEKRLAPRDESPAGRSPKAIVLLNGMAAAVATAVDFLVVLGLVEVLGLRAGPATALGALVGGAANFFANRIVTFRSREAPVLQAARYAFVSLVSAGLNGGGVALLTLHPELGYVWAWWIVRGIVFFSWNLPLQRDYVFASPGPRSGTRPAVEAA